MGADRVLAHNAGVEGARPYGIAGNQPADAVVTARKPHGQGVLHVSDRPYVPPSYAERATCSGTRTNGERCKAKARLEGPCCEAHIDQE